MSSLNTVRKMTGVCRPRRRNWRRTSSPSIPGMRQSSNSTSASPPASKYFSVSLPFEKLVTAKPSSIRFRPSDSRKKSSSSTSRSRLCVRAVSSTGGLESELFNAKLTSLVCSVIAFHFDEKSAQSAALKVPIKPDVEAAGIVGIAPNNCRRYVAPRFGLTHAFLDRIRLHADEIGWHVHWL